MASSSKTATSSRTEVRSPTRTSTWANTRGNFTATVTGGAGKGATSVVINTPKKNPGKRKRVTVGYVSSGLNAGQFAVRVNDKIVQLRHDKGMAQRVATLYRKNKMRERAARSLRKARKSK